MGTYCPDVRHEKKKLSDPNFPAFIQGTIYELPSFGSKEGKDLPRSQAAGNYKHMYEHIHGVVISAEKGVKKNRFLYSPRNHL